jgi:hypothetical protein
MRRIYKSIFSGVVVASAVIASGGSGGGHNPDPSGTAEITISSSIVPAGGTAQVRFSLTEPVPISSTGGRSLLQADGLAIWSSNGVASGVGLLKNGVLTFRAVDPTGVLGTNVDGPFLTATLSVPQGIATGTLFPVTWSADSWLTSPTGPVSFSIKPGNITVGGSIFISGVYPGGGTFPAGTLVRILGGGFQPNARMQTPVKYSSITIQPNEIDLYLKEQTTLDTRMFQVTNPDGSTVTFYSYLKGTMIRQPSVDLLRNAEFAFPLQTHAIATVGSGVGLAPGQWVGLALQNPNPGPAVVTLRVTSGGNNSTSIPLPSGARVVDTLAALLDEATVKPGETVQLTSTSMIQIMGLTGDENAQTLTPFVPSF